MLTKSEFNRLHRRLDKLGAPKGFLFRRIQWLLDRTAEAVGVVK